MAKITLWLPLHREKEQKREKFVSNARQWLRDKGYKYVAAKELQDGIFNIHFAVIVRDELDLVKIENYILKRLMKLWGEERWKDEYSDIAFAQDSGWIYYLFKLGDEPSDFVPWKRLALRPITQNIKKHREC